MSPLVASALQLCERKGLLFYELLARLRGIAREFGATAAWQELALQAALADEDASWQRQKIEDMKKG